MRIIYLMLVLFAVTACGRESFDYGVRDGSTNNTEVPVSLASLKLSVNLQSYVTKTTENEDADLSNFIVCISDVNRLDTITYLYKDLPEILTLKVGTYKIEAKSHDVKTSQWNAPYFYASEEIYIEEGKVNEIGALTCKLSNILVSVKMDEKLADLVNDDAKITISVGEGTLEFGKNETRIGSFIADSENNILIAELTGTFKTGEKINMPAKSFQNVKAGEHRSVTFTYYATGTDPDVEIDDENGVAGLSIEIDAKCEVTTIDIDINFDNKDKEENTDVEEIPAEGVQKALSISGNGFDIDQPMTIYGYTEIKVNIISEAGLQNIKVLIDSETLVDDILTDVGLTSSFDLADPGVYGEGLMGLGFPVGDDVIGQKEIVFDITEFTPLLGIYGAGNHRFVITIVDSGNQEVTKTLHIITE